MEEELKFLRDQRAQVKRELTLVSNKPSTAINRKESISTLQPPVDKPDELFNNFSAIHLEYVDIMDDNDSHGGVQSSHNKSHNKSFCLHTKSVFTQHIGVIKLQFVDKLDELAFLHDRFASLIKDHSIVDHVAAQVYFDEANQCIITLDKILAELKQTGDKIGHDYFALCEQVRERIVAIKCTIVRAKAGMTRTPLSLTETQPHVPYNNDISSPLTQSQPPTASSANNIQSATLSVS